MKRWKQWARLAVIAGASFVLLVTVLPEVASAIGLGPLANRLASSSSCSSSGSSGSGSSSTCRPQGTVIGTVTVTGKPAGFVPAETGAGACPDSGPPGMVCANPIYTLADRAGSYSLPLTVGKWRMAGFYEVHPYGGAFLGTSRVVTVSAGKKITEHVTAPYRKPAALKGRITVTGVPAGAQIQELSLVLCPSYAPLKSAFPSIACVNRYSSQFGDSGGYSIGGLPPGTWTAYAGFCTQFGNEFDCLTDTKGGKPVTLVGGRTSTVDVTTPFIVPGNGLLSGTATVSGAPTGFSDPVAVSACQKGNENCQTVQVSAANKYTLLLGDGTWYVNALYQAAPFYNSINGPTVAVTVSSGRRTTIDLTDPYQVLGEAAGAITVIRAPRDVPIESYTVLACPASSPWTGGFASPTCLTEYSGPGGFGGFLIGDAVPTSLNAISHARPEAGSSTPPLNSFQLTTLTPGGWLLYAGYETEFGSYTNPVGAGVTITAGASTIRNLTVPYQIPTVGAVTGSVSVVGAPANQFESGVEACSAPPTATSCTDEQDAYNESSGAYQLTLSPGTWWVAGYVDVYGNNTTQDETITPAREVTIRAGVQTTEDFTVVVSS